MNFDAKTNKFSILRKFCHPDFTETIHMLWLIE